MLMGAGALTMYYLDPDRGRRRRVTLRDSFVHGRHVSARFFGRFRRDLANRAEGTLAETKRRLRRDDATDETLQQRVRTVLGRVVSHPQAIEVRCKDGSVELSGWIMTWELDDLRHAVRAVRGVREVTSCLHTAEKADHIPDLQGGRPRRERISLFQEKWSPTARVLAGGAGLALLASRLLRGRPFASLSSLAGALLVARSALNRPLHTVASAGIHVDKTLHVHAPRDLVYAFWLNPENYPKVFSHVTQVEPEADGVYRWHAAGPGGMPLSWTGHITRKVPGHLVEWHSLAGSVVENHGVIHLDDEADGYTRVQVQMSYVPPAGLLGHALAAILGIDPRHVMHHDFVQLKSVLERGVTTAHGQEVCLEELDIAQPQPPQGQQPGGTEMKATA
jgi:uncharacterized membrane protein